MIFRKKMPAYKGDKPRSFILLWVEEDMEIKGTLVPQPYFFVPTNTELKNRRKG